MKKKEETNKKNRMLDNKRLTFAFFPGDSFWHNLNPTSKLVFLILLTILTLLINSLIFLAIISIMIFILALSIGISLKFLTRKLRFILIILFFSVILNIFFNAIPNEENIVLFYLFGLEFLPIRRIAVYFALRAFFIIIILYSSTIIYTNTTSMKDFVYSLMRLGIPYRYCFAFMVGIKYIPIIEQEAKTIALAQRARGFGREKVKRFRGAYNLVFERMTATLVSVLRKAHTTSISMESRCFGIYKERTNLIKIKFKLRDILFIILSLFIFLGIILYLFNLLNFPQFPSLYNIYISFI